MKKNNKDALLSSNSGYHNITSNTHSVNTTRSNHTPPDSNLKLEVHEHCYVSGPKANGWQYKFSHSHPGGGIPHQHPQTGPACYTIDKDEWAKKTGLRGGGRKKFTPKPTGIQLAWKALEDWQTKFEIHIGEPTPQYGEGPGIALPMRLMLAFGMKAKVMP